MNSNTYRNVILRLVSAGMSESDALAIRRAAMTLDRWHELECGDSNNYASWTITRGRKEVRHGQHAGGHGLHTVFTHDENGTPFEERHFHKSNTVLYTRIPDRENGAIKRIQRIMQEYPGLGYYIQGDPRGAPLYVLRAGDIPEGENADSYYNRGIAVYK